jgi:glycosyltransferase involved in cell wall biosynthesis
MKILFIHQNFPAQYKHLARHVGALADHQVTFITQLEERQLPGVRKILYKPHRAVSPQVHHYLRESEGAVINAQAVAQSATRLRKSGFVPDVILGHNGWGEIWYLKDVFPETPLIGYFEFYYQMTGTDVGFDPLYPVTLDTAPRIRTKNLGNLLALNTVDLGQCPTGWQKSLYPQRHHSMLHVIHEGIDSTVVKPDPAARLEIAEAGIQVHAGEEIVTYVARNLEPCRGFPSFMRSLPKILAARPRARVLVVGGDGVSYSAPLPAGETFRNRMLAELGDSVDLARVHFLGTIPYTSFIHLLQVSRVHVYLTYPFVLSWSMLEAMSAGCLVVGSRTPPVEEVISHGANGLLVDFFAPDQIADYVIEALGDPRAFASVRENARQTVIDRYDLKTVCLPAQVRLLNTLVPRERRVAIVAP